MTICKTLKEKTIGEIKVEAVESLDKYSDVPRYEVTILRPNWGYAEVVKASRTTWARKFKAIVEELEAK